MRIRCKYARACACDHGFFRHATCRGHPGLSSSPSSFSSTSSSSPSSSTLSPETEREPFFYSSFFVNGHSLHEFPRVQIVVKLTVPAKVNVNFMYARGTSELTIQEFLCIDVNLGVFRFHIFSRVACLF